MSWAKSVSPSSLLDLARELRWKLGPGDPSPGERTWRIPPQELAAVAIRWPVVYANPEAPRFSQFVERGLRRKVQFAYRDVPQPYLNVVVFEIDVEGATYRHGIDVGDPHDVAEAAVSSCDVHFKYQFSEDGYPFPNVVPGGYVPKGSELYAFLPHLRRLRDRDRNVFDVYGRFSPRMGTEIRARARDLLAKQTAFRHEGTLAKVRRRAVRGSTSRLGPPPGSPGPGACPRRGPVSCSVATMPSARTPFAAKSVDPERAAVVEVGCGRAQLSNYLPATTGAKARGTGAAGPRPRRRTLAASLRAFRSDPAATDPLCC